MRLALALLMICLPAVAEEYPDQLDLAANLGGLLGAETPCSLSYDVGVVSAYIDKNADPADLSVMSSLTYFSGSKRISFDQMSETEKAVQCRVALRSAKALGFVE